MPNDLLPEEQNYNGLVEPGNIDLFNRPIVQNVDGSYSTVRTITVTNDKGQIILLPTVIGGEVLPDDQAIAHSKQTGEHLGIFDNEYSANQYDKSMHDAMHWTGTNNKWK